MVRITRSCLLLIALVAILNTFAIAQTWQRTNGPYAECGKGVIVTNAGVVVSTCAGTTIGTDNLRSWKLSSSEADEIASMNDGSHLMVRHGSVIYDTMWEGYGVNTNFPVQSAIWITDSLELASVDGVGIMQSKDRGRHWGIIMVGLNNLNVRLIRADVAGYVYLTDATGQIYRSTDSGWTWSPLWSARKPIDVLFVARDGVVWIAGEGFLKRSADHAQSFVDVPLPSGAIPIVLDVHSDTIALATKSRGIQFSTNGGLGWTSVNQDIDSATVTGVALLGSRILATTKFGGLFVADKPDASWQFVETYLAPGDFIGLAKPSETRLYAATTTHGVFRTEDRGEHWVRCHYDPLDTSKDLACHGSSLVLGTRHGLWHSSDAGNTWSMDSTLNGYDRIWSVVVDREGIFYLLASNTIWDWPRKPFRSLDGGANWTEFSGPEALLPISMEIDSEGKLLFFGDEKWGNVYIPYLWTSTDRGDHWVKTEMPSFLRNWNQFTCAPNGDIYISTQYGLFRSQGFNYDAWSQIGDEYARDPFWPLVFRSGTNFYSWGHFDSLAETTDRGMTWRQYYDSGLYANTFTLAFGGELFGAGYGGVYRLSGPSNAVAKRIPHDLYLRVYYTINGASGISVQLPEVSKLRLEILDELGRNQATLCDEVLSGGSFQYSLPSDLSSGVYFVRAALPNKIATEKFSVIHE
jgi:photosystem II stability/assembly factor-like uncharacterized protein